MPMKVLVIVDVQNCFMYNPEITKTGLNLEDENKNDLSEDMMKELEVLHADSEFIVFSRDFHPLNHISLEGDEEREAFNPFGVWPVHCRNRSIKCESRESAPAEPPAPVETPAPLNNLVEIKTGKLIRTDDPEYDTLKSNKNDFLEVIGTEISYEFFKSNIFREPVRKLIRGNRDGTLKIGLTSTKRELTEDGEIPPLTVVSSTTQGVPNTDAGAGLYESNSKKYISITKGEYCNKEAYSAFNYHIEYDTRSPSNPVNNPIEPSKENSTGLWEWILANKGDNTEIIITVCGLVGNVCVMHTLLQGIALWNKIFSGENPDITVKFVYSLCGTRFAPAVTPNVTKPVLTDETVRTPTIDLFNSSMDETGLGKITVSPVSSVPHVSSENKITKFEILDYDGSSTIFIGTFAQIAGGGRSRSRRSRRSRSLGMRRTQFTRRGRRRRGSYKNKRGAQSRKRKSYK
jgi:nicotinamidase-related amidase